MPTGCDHEPNQNTFHISAFRHFYKSQSSKWGHINSSKKCIIWSLLFLIERLTGFLIFFPLSHRDSNIIKFMIKKSLKWLEGSHQPLRWTVDGILEFFLSSFETHNSPFQHFANLSFLSWVSLTPPTPGIWNSEMVIKLWYHISWFYHSCHECPWHLQLPLSETPKWRLIHGFSTID